MVLANSESEDLLGIADGHKIAANYEPSEEDQKLAANIMERYRDAKEARAPYDTDWEMQRQYFKGDQQIHYNRSTGEIVRISRKDQRRLYSQVNKIRNTTRSLIGKLTKVVPTFTVRPATDDSDEIFGALAAEKFLQYFRSKENLDVIYTDSNQSLAIFGSGVMELYWDPDAGRKLAWCQAAQITTEDLSLVGQPCEEAIMMGVPPEQSMYQEVCEGDLKVRWHDLRNVVVEPGVVDGKKLRYLFTSEVISLTECRQRFPHMAPFISEETGFNSDWGNHISVTGRVGAEVLREHVELVTYHEAPTLFNPKGRIVYLANERVLEERDGYWDKIGRLPFYWFHSMRNPGEFYGESFIKQVWHRQKELNEGETAAREYQEGLVRQKILVPFRARIGADEFSTVSGQVVYYNPAAGPVQPLQMPEMPQSLFNRQAIIRNDIDEGAGITGAEAGVTPMDPNGRAMAILEAESDQQLGPILLRNNAEWKCMHKDILVLVNEFYAEDRKFTVGGQDSPTETFLFSEMKLCDGFDLVLETDDGLSQNKQMRLNQVAMLAQMGFYMDPNTGQMDPKKMAKQAKIPLPEVGPDLTASEWPAALAAIKRIERGEQVFPAPEDDPDIFAKVALRWLRGKGRTYRNKDPMVYQSVQGMYQYYAMALYMQQQGQQPPEGQSFGGGGSVAGAAVSAPGGTPNQPAPQSEGVGGDAAQTVAGANSAAEGAVSNQGVM